MEIKRMAFTVDEVAESLGLHPNTVYKLVSENKLSHVKLGRKILISKTSLDEWLKSGNQQSKNIS